MAGLLALAAVLAGCDAPRRAPTEPPAVTATRPTATGPSEAPLRLATRSDGTMTGSVDGILLEVGVPPGRYGACRPEGVLAVLRELTDAIAVDPTRAASFAKAGFQWYSATENGDEVVPNRHAVLRDAPSFRAYLEQRHRRHERLRLIALRVLGDGNFMLQLVRVADDLAPSLGGRHHVAEGKGKVDCPNRSIIAFSHAMFPASRTSPAGGVVREGLRQAVRGRRGCGGLDAPSRSVTSSAMPMLHHEESSFSIPGHGAQEALAP